MVRWSLLWLLLLVAGSVPRHALLSAAPSNAVRVQRIVALGKLWATIRYFHPWLAYQKIDWDAAFVRAIVDVEHADTSHEYALAVQKMLATLGDPATGVVEPSTSVNPSEADPDPSFRLDSEGILHVRLRNYVDLRDYRRTQAALTRVRALLQQCKGVIFDLRWPTGAAPNAGDSLRTAFFRSSLANSLSSIPISAVSQRALVYSGYGLDASSRYTDYFGAFYTVNGWVYRPYPGTSDHPIVFLINSASILPEIVPSLQDAGRAWIVGEQGTGDSGAIHVQHFALVEGIEAQFRLTELLHDDGGIGFQPDIEVAAAAGGTDPAYAKAYELLRGAFRPEPGKRQAVPARAVSTYETRYEEQPYPSRELRLLGLFRFWGVIHYFYPHKAQMKGDWDRLVEEFLPRFEQAGNAREYVFAVAELAAHLDDSHTAVSGIGDYIGLAVPSVRVRMVENLPVVIAVGPEARQLGVAIGDIILKIDGEPVDVRLKSLSRIMSGSTEAARSRNLADALLAAREPSPVTLLLQHGPTEIASLTLPRQLNNPFPAQRGRDGPIIQRLSDSIGYVDLDRLPVNQVDELFEQLKDTTGIIFDMRGYPQVTATLIAGRLATQPITVYARSRRPIVMPSIVPDQAGDILLQSARNEVSSQFAASAKPRYTGKTVLLVDEFTQSQAEDLGMQFREANGTVFVGSETAGANGSATGFQLPGGIRVSFTGEEIVWPDGRALQRVGLVPDISVTATITGVRTHRDEILERAIDYLNGR